MDEPFAAVDAVTERAIITILRELRARGKTVVVVHHDLQTADEYFDWVTLLNVEIVASGPIAATFTPANPAPNLRRTRSLPARWPAHRRPRKRMTKNVFLCGPHWPFVDKEFSSWSLVVLRGKRFFFVALSGPSWAKGFLRGP